MTTPPPLSEIDSQPPRKRSFVLWLIPFAALGVVAMLFLQALWPDTAPPEPEQPPPVLTQENAGVLCRSLE